MDFIASLLPIAIPLCFVIPTTRLLLEPTSYVSFFGLFWFPYHDDLPYRLLFNVLVVGFINAALSLLAPRFPRLLKSYSAGASPKLPFNGQKLLPDNDWWGIAFYTITLGGWLGNSMGMSLSYRFVVSLALYTLLAALGIYVLLQAAKVLWIYIRHYPLRRFLLRTGNKLGRSLENSNPSAAEDPSKTGGQLSTIQTDSA